MISYNFAENGIPLMLTLHTGSGNLKLIRKLGINSEFSYGYKQFEGAER